MRKQADNFRLEIGSIKNGWRVTIFCILQFAYQKFNANGCMRAGA